MRLSLARTRALSVGVMVLAALPALVFPARVQACSLAGNSPFNTDPQQVGVDRTAPELAQPTVSLQQVDHGDQGCQSKCGFDFSAKLSNLATDDTTSVDRMGYRVTSVAGTEGLIPSWRDGEAIIGSPDGTLTLFWNGNDGFLFTLQIVAIDLAGNESEPRLVHIQDTTGGCRIGGGRGRGALAPLIVGLALAIAWYRRRADARDHSA
jgi:hypothetical protein